jgi:hypothetical protein
MKQYVGDLFQQHKKKRKVLAKTPSFTSAIELICPFIVIIYFGTVNSRMILLTVGLEIKVSYCYNST